LARSPAAITLKRAYADGTVAVEMDPLSLLCRLAMMVPPPRHHTVKYAGVLAAASKLRARIAPAPVPPTEAAEPRPRKDAAATGRGAFDAAHVRGGRFGMSQVQGANEAHGARDR
jgi:hypothetical protein